MTDIIQKNKISSIEIAELAGKRHSDLLRDIRNMEEAWVNVTERKFALSEYVDSTGRKLPMYELTKQESLYIATKFNDEARAKLIVRWEYLERNSTIDFSDPNTVLQLAQNWADEQAKRIEAERVIEEQKPKVLFAQALEVSEQSILIGQLAKILKNNGIEIGQNRLFLILREEGYLHKSGEQYNSPTQKSMELGLLETKTTTINNPDGSVRVTRTTKVKPKGQQYFINKFMNK